MISELKSRHKFLHVTLRCEQNLCSSFRYEYGTRQATFYWATSVPSDVLLSPCMFLHSWLFAVTRSLPLTCPSRLAIISIFDLRTSDLLQQLHSLEQLASFQVPPCQRIKTSISHPGLCSWLLAISDCVSMG